MPTLIACPHCSSHFKSDAAACPHCDAPLPGRRIAATATALLMGLTVAGCEKTGEPTTPPDTSVGEPEYGVPAADEGGGDEGGGDDEGGGW